MATNYFEQPGLPLEVKKMFRQLAEFRSQTQLVAATDGTGVPTLSILDVNGHLTYGINTKTAGLPMSTVRFVKELLIEEFGKSAHVEVLKHAEADSIISAFNKGYYGTKGTKAIMCVDRKTCNFCKMSLRRLLPLIKLDGLIVWSPDELGKITCKEYLPAPASIKKTSI